jgi:hypothetical protein
MFYNVKKYKQICIKRNSGTGPGSQDVMDNDESAHRFGLS